ncbi:hypothetical protein E4S40_00915 [Algoriphagus kandeliae]|uniref:DUF2029 domain-containing protein n=1 Tax=Algoriphagus kandeliae TaxID=2562278 RepID=A0A4Y9QY23_9BACT|nr:hypothetical protein [Algoriphagus kandeliae]TFV97249.1 hypothetical protein E4S40_00915 [Algoriphagus kandeliae]
MISLKNRSYKEVIWFSLLFLIGYTLYFLVKFIPYGVDIKIHNFYLIEYLENGYFPIPPGYYFLIYLLDLFVSWKYQFLLSSILVLLFFFGWKYKIILEWLIKEFEVKEKKAFIISLGIMFFGPLVIPSIDKDFWYLGKFTPTIWHNSTLIAALPFSLLLFKQTLVWWERKTSSSYYKIWLLALLVLLIKPSYLFCFIPLLPLFSGIYYGFNQKVFFQALLFSFGMLGLIWVEKYLIYSWDPMITDFYEVSDQPQIEIRPFKVWLHYAFEPIWDFFSSFSLSIAFIVLFGKNLLLKNQKPLAFSFSLLLLSLIIYWLFAETGFREWHANFYWQIPISYLIHLVIMIGFVFRRISGKNGKYDLKTLTFLTLFSLHVLSGIAYWGRIFTERIIS